MRRHLSLMMDLIGYVFSNECEITKNMSYSDIITKLREDIENSTKINLYNIDDYKQNEAEEL